MCAHLGWSCVPVLLTNYLTRIDRALVHHADELHAARVQHHHGGLKRLEAADASTLQALSTHLSPSELLTIIRRDLVPPSTCVMNHWRRVGSPNPKLESSTGGAGFCLVEIDGENHAMHGQRLPLERPWDFDDYRIAQLVLKVGQELGLPHITLYQT